VGWKQSKDFPYSPRGSPSIFRPCTIGGKGKRNDAFFSPRSTRAGASPGGGGREGKRGGLAPSPFLCRDKGREKKRRNVFFSHIASLRGGAKPRLVPRKVKKGKRKKMRLKHGERCPSSITILFPALCASGRRRKGEKEGKEGDPLLSFCLVNDENPANRVSAAPR